MHWSLWRCGRNDCRGSGGSATAWPPSRARASTPDEARRRLMQQFLNRTTTFQAATHFRHQVLLRHVYRDALALQPSIQHPTRMLLAGLASRAVLADAGAPPQAQRTEKRRPSASRLRSQPAHNIENQINPRVDTGTYRPTKRSRELNLTPAGMDVGKITSAQLG